MSQNATITVSMSPSATNRSNSACDNMPGVALITDS